MDGGNCQEDWMIIWYNGYIMKLFPSFLNYLLKKIGFGGILIMFVYVKRKGEVKNVEFYTDHGTKR